MTSRSASPSAAGQRPRVHVAPKARKTYGDIAADFAADYGLTPDPWQALVLDDWLGETAGKWSSLTCGLSVPRQNGKNALLEVREIFGTVGRGERILHTAHEVKTARKAFKRLQHFFGTRPNDPGAKYPELNALVAEVRNVNGQEAVVLTNGGSVEVVARSKNSGRGFTVDVLVMDEAQEMTDDDLEALMPTTSAAPLGNPQWIFTGTPPSPRANGEVFNRTRVEALGGKSKRLSWHEWSCDGSVDLDDHAAWHAANPALGTRLQFEVLEGERSRFSDDGFARERLGMWASSAGHRVIPAETWDDAGDETSVATGTFALGIEVGPDAAWASVSLAGTRSDGSWHIELDNQRAGATWVVPYVKALVGANPAIRAVAADAGSPSSTLFEDLDKAGIRVTAPKVSELGQACTNLLTGLLTGTVRHTRQPQMSVAASIAGKRRLGDTGMWVWSRASTTSDITPIQSATLALWAAQAANVKRPSRRMPGQRTAMVM